MRERLIRRKEMDEALFRYKYNFLSVSDKAMPRYTSFPTESFPFELLS